MYICFEDESKAQRGQDFTVVGGLVLEESEYPPVMRELRSVKRKYYINPSFNRMVEHAQIPNGKDGIQRKGVAQKGCTEIGGKIEW